MITEMLIGGAVILWWYLSFRVLRNFCPTHPENYNLIDYIAINLLVVFSNIVLTVLCNNHI